MLSYILLNWLRHKLHTILEKEWIINSILNKYLYEMKYKKSYNIIIPNKIQISKIYNIN